LVRKSNEKQVVTEQKQSSKSKVDMGAGVGSGGETVGSPTFADLIGNPSLKGLMG